MQEKSAARSRGVQPEDVCAAADAVLASGQRPTIERVRAQLGRGSPNTVGPMLEIWYATLGERLTAAQNPLDGSSASDGSNSLPAPVLRAATALWGRAKKLADEAAQLALANDWLAVEDQTKKLSEEKEAVRLEQQRMNERSEALASALQAKDQQIADLLRQVKALQLTADATSNEVKRVSAENTKLLSTVQSGRARLDEQAEEHRQERLGLEQRAVAQERRLLEDVDRNRQEVKRLTAWMAEETKRASINLKAAKDESSALKLQLDSVGALHDGLARELQSTQEQLQAARAQLDQYQQQTAKVLNNLHLKMHRPMGLQGAKVLGLKTSTSKKFIKARGRP